MPIIGPNEPANLENHMAGDPPTEPERHEHSREEVIQALENSDSLIEVELSWDDLRVLYASVVVHWPASDYKKKLVGYIESAQESLIERKGEEMDNA